MLVEQQKMLALCCMVSQQRVVDSKLDDLSRWMVSALKDILGKEGCITVESLRPSSVGLSEVIS